MYNRLQLNFQLESAEDRAQFVREYLASIPFTPNTSELETISNYILWGKNSSGKNPQQEGSITLKQWAAHPVESLEGLMDSPGFQETEVRSITEPKTTIRRKIFNRQDALREAPAHLIPTFETLWRNIDEIELTLNYYELFCGKRKLPPREKLLNRFTEEEQKYLNEKALRLTQYKYLKLKHLLVELRGEQYTYYDTYTIHVSPHSVDPQLPSTDKLYFGEDVLIRPLGLISIYPKLFNIDLYPAQFTDSELAQISTYIWSLQQESHLHIIDFRDPAHILNLYQMRAELQRASEEDPSELYTSTLSVLNTLKFYEQMAGLTDLQLSILNQKIKNIPNSLIVRDINQTYNKSYNENYISTLFHQKIIPLIAQAAATHFEIAQNLFFPENFKKCKDCGRILLLNSQNFVRQKKSIDGFSPRCKACQKIKRSKYI